MAANIHSFDHNQGNNARGNQANLLGDSSAGFRDMFSGLPGLNTKEMKDPRKESFPYMLYINFCPMLTMVSFTVIVCIALSCVFTLQIAVDGLTPGQATQFLQINVDGPMTSHLYNQYDALKRKI